MADGEEPSWFSSSRLSLQQGKQNPFDLKKRESPNFGFGIVWFWGFFAELYFRVGPCFQDKESFVCFGAVPDPGVLL